MALVTTTARTTAGVLVLVGWLSACGGATSALEADLRETGLVLYLPMLAGELPVRVSDAAEPGVIDMDPSPSTSRPHLEETASPSSVEVVDGTVVVTYTRDGAPAYELRELPAPRGELCRAVQQIAGSECAEEDGVMRSSMEEQAVVAVVRGRTLLVLEGLVRETHPDLVDDAVLALQRAPAVTPSALVGLERSGEPSPQHDGLSGPGGGQALMPWGSLSASREASMVVLTTATR